MSSAGPVRPYKIHVDDATLEDLHERLARTRWPDQVTGAGWDYGTDVNYLRELCGYWREGFDWRAQERAINELAHFRAEIGGAGRPLRARARHRWAVPDEPPRPGGASCAPPLARFSELPRGGHFGEHEEPELVADDLRAFLRDLRSAGPSR